MGEKKKEEKKMRVRVFDTNFNSPVSEEKTETGKKREEPTDKSVRRPKKKEKENEKNLDSFAGSGF